MPDFFVSGGQQPELPQSGNVPDIVEPTPDTSQKRIPVPDFSNVLPPLQSQDQQTVANYPQTLVDTRYDYHPGVRVLPTAAPDGTQADVVTKCFQGYWTKTVEWTFERNIFWPLCPTPFTNDPNEVLIEATVQPATPLLGMDNGFVTRISGRYVYRLLKGIPITFQGAPIWGPFPTSSEPSCVNTPSSNLIPAEIFVSMIDTSHIQ